jgi:glycosyltransferase involved in cell wall biosynthesis
MSANKLIKPQKIKILHIITGIDVGGAENHLLSLVKGLDRCRYDIAVAYLKGNGELKEEFKKIGISPIYIGLRFNYDITALWRLYRLIRKNKYDIVHTHLFHADIYGVLAGFLARTHIIISSEHNEEQFLKKKLYSFLHRWASLPCSKLIAISGCVKKYMLATGIKDANKIEVVYYGLDWNKYDSLGDLSYVRKEFNIDEKEILLGTVARLTEQKGLNYLLEAFVKVLETEPKCKLIIVGQGELEKQLKNLSKNLGIENKVIFTGFRKDIPEIMSSIDIFILPSLWEGFGLVLLEAMAAKKAIVATDIGAIPEIVLDDKTGILAPPANAEALANGVLRLVRQKNLAKTMGERGRERLETHFGIDKMVKRVEKIYDGVN